jgi:hypothetical protein
MFALALGTIYLLVGVLGFLPPLRGGVLMGVMGPSEGLLLGIFAVNWFHNLAHILIGIAGLALYRSFAGSKAYALVLGIAYAGLFLLGVLSSSVGTLGGLLPLNGPDNILHVLTALVALAIYFTARIPEPEQGAAQSRG